MKLSDKELDKIITETVDFSVYTVKELRDFTGSIGIVGRWGLNKAGLISEIMKYKKAKSDKRQDTTKARDNKAEVGMLVAYRKDDGILSTGRLLQIKSKTFVVEDVKKAEAEILKERVMWYKGTRWPKFIYNELKHIV